MVGCKGCNYDSKPSRICLRCTRHYHGDEFKDEFISKVDTGSYCDDTKWIGDFYCRSCNAHLSRKIDNNMNFCCNCGAKLDWNVTYNSEILEIEEGKSIRESEVEDQCLKCSKNETECFFCDNPDYAIKPQ